MALCTSVTGRDAFSARSARARLWSSRVKAVMLCEGIDGAISFKMRALVLAGFATSTTCHEVYPFHNSLVICMPRLPNASHAQAQTKHTKTGHSLLTHTCVSCWKPFPLLEKASCDPLCPLLTPANHTNLYTSNWLV